jgi:Protein of unknown function (DUF1016).
MGTRKVALRETFISEIRSIIVTARQFYRIYPILHAVRAQFNWLQYKLLIHIEDPDRREYYELENLIMQNHV